MSGLFISAYEDRIRRAHEMFRNGAVRKQADGSYLVRGQYSHNVYSVTIEYDSDPRGLLMDAHCTCPDWAKMQWAIHEYPLNPGISQIDGIPVCKHILAVMLADHAIEPPKEVTQWPTHCAWQRSYSASRL